MDYTAGKTAPICEWERLISAQLRLPRVVPCKDEVEAGLSRSLAIRARQRWGMKEEIGIGLPPHSDSHWHWHFHALKGGPSQVCRSLNESGGMQRLAKLSNLYSRTLTKTRMSGEWLWFYVGPYSDVHSMYGVDKRS
jgi:hypothetical protein